MDTLFIINQLLLPLSSIAQIILQHAIILHIVKVPAPFKKLLLSGIIFFAVTTVATTFFHYLSNIIFALWITLLIACYKFIFGQPLAKSALLAIGQLILVTFVEYLSHLVVFMMKGDTWEMVYGENSMLRLIIAGALLILYLLIRCLDFRILPRKTSGRTGKLWGVYLTFLLFFSYPNLLYMERNQHIISNWLEIYNVVLFLVFFLYNLIYLLSLNKISDISQQLEVQQLYSGTLQKSIDELRGFKHDFSNIISSINGLVEMGQLNELREYLQNVNTEVLKIKTSDLVNTEFQEFPVLYGVLLSKVSLAELMGVAFDVSAHKGLALHYCELLDFSRIIGILLDNALEAAAQSEERFVHMEISERKGQHHITIRNSCNGEVHIDQIFQEHFTTKENHSGLGLFQVKAIIEKYQKRGYEMEIISHYSDNFFTQKLIV